MTEQTTITAVTAAAADAVASWVLQSDLMGATARELYEHTAGGGYEAIRDGVEGLRDFHYQVAYDGIMETSPGGLERTPDERLKALENHPEHGLVSGVSPLRIDLDDPEVKDAIYRAYVEQLAELAREEAAHEEVANG